MSERDDDVTQPSGNDRRRTGRNSPRPARDHKSPRAARDQKSPRPARDHKPPRAARDENSPRPPRGGPGRAPDARSTGRGQAHATGAGRRSASAPARHSAPAPERQRRPAEPTLPDGLDIGMLDRSVRAELRTLTKPNAEVVGAHLVAAGLSLDSDPQRALAHARAARSRASRLAVVREAVGVAAYAAEEWTEAITELRTARRISGDPRNLPLIADCERALGRPGQAVRLLSDPGVARLDPEARAELLIVVAGARRDLGQLDAALAVLARGGLDREHPRPGSTRLWYAYADALEAAGRAEEAASWFAASAALDVEVETDAAERAAALL
jgi:hypothetical protein